MQADTVKVKGQYSLDVRDLLGPLKPPRISESESINNYIVSAEYQFCSKKSRSIIINMSDTPTTMKNNVFFNNIQTLFLEA